MLLDEIDRPAITRDRLYRARLLLERAVALRGRASLPAMPSSSARWPPAELPHAPIASRSRLYSLACARSQRTAVLQSSSAAGNDSFAREPVIHRHGNKPQPGEMLDVARYVTVGCTEAGFIPFDPSATVNDDDPGPRFALRILLHGEVQLPIPAGPIAIGKIAVDDNVIAGRRLGYEEPWLKAGGPQSPRSEQKVGSNTMSVVTFSWMFRLRVGTS